MTRSLSVLVLVVGCQVVTYLLVARPRMMSWRATEAELEMPLPGDGPGSLLGGSTRAITIDAPAADVWAWLIQLGADRGGFFSYAFIEKALGYDKRGTDLVPQFQDMEVGRVVPASLEGARPLIDFRFPVLAVEPGRSFVLENWGTFRLEEIDPDRTRLIVRTNGQHRPDLSGRVAEFVTTPLHYLMERRMLLGFKARSEAGPGVRLSAVPDHVWLASLVLSGAGIVLLTLLSGGTAGVVLPVLLGVGWLLTLLIAPPRPAFGLGLVLLVAGALVATT